ncbi:hypothetical protein MTF65_02805 [Streptomyces sp. APSN-46.1]|nr:hypothetical protein [Streptomyces sp. APSN-46.1]
MTQAFAGVGSFIAVGAAAGSAVAGPVADTLGPAAALSCRPRSRLWRLWYPSPPGADHDGPRPGKAEPLPSGQPRRGGPRQAHRRDHPDGSQLRRRGGDRAGTLPRGGPARFPGGARDFVAFVDAQAGAPVHPDVVGFEWEDPRMAGTLEVALRWCGSHGARVRSYANSEPTPGGGTHTAGFRDGVAASTTARGTTRAPAARRGRTTVLAGR